METILIAEDDADIRNVLHDLLSMEGYTVISVSNGKEALDFINDKFVPDMLITDIMMPEMSGIELLKAVDGKLHVIVYSASGHFKKVVEAHNAIYISKPFDMDALINLVRTTIRSKYEKKSRVSTQS